MEKPKNNMLIFSNKSVNGNEASINAKKPITNVTLSFILTLFPIIYLIEV